MVKSMGGAIGFIADKELVVCPWEKKPDVELVDPAGELLTIYLDVTLPALHQSCKNNLKSIETCRHCAKSCAQFPEMSELAAS